MTYCFPCATYKEFIYGAVKNKLHMDALIVYDIEDIDIEHME